MTKGEANKDGRDEGEPNWRRLIGISLFGVIGLLVGIAVIQFAIVRWNKDELAAYGISGDFFGLSNALFSALAFAFLIVTLSMQKHELKMQRKELELNREVMQQQQEVMQQQKDEFVQQNESLTRQTFERTFFSMLSMHTEIVQGMAVRGGQQPGGRPAFMHFTHLLHQNMHQHGNNSSFVDCYESWYRGSEPEIGHYFRTLYNMMRFIDERGGEDKKMYARLVRAQLSSEELKLLFWNGLSKFGKEKFKPLIERYSLLKHVPDDERIEKIKNAYDTSAYGTVHAPAQPT